MKIPIAILAVAVSAFLLSACGDEPPDNPAGPSASVLRLEVQAPRDLAPGNVAQLKAVAHLATGRADDVTRRTTWSSLRSAVASVTGEGLVSAVTMGDALIAGSFGGQSVQIEIVVVPRGTYKLRGTVRELDGRGVAGARIEVVSHLARVEATTDEFGSYVLHGVPGFSTIRLTKEGYVTRDEYVLIADHTVRDFEFSLPTGGLILQGDWTLTITASSSCGSQLPAEAITRRYGASVAQRGDDLAITLSGNKFASGFADHNQIDGRIRETAVRLSFQKLIADYLPYPGVVERMETNRLYAPYGEASISLAGGSYTGMLNGSITVGDHSSGGYRETVNCTATDHQIVMQRR